MDNDDFDLGKYEYDFYMETRVYIEELIVHYAFLEKDLRRNISQEIKRLKKKFKAENPKIDKKKIDEIIDEANKYFYPRYARYSFITLLCSTLEKQLLQFCNVIQFERNYPVTIKQVHAHTFIEQVEIYLNQDRMFRRSIDWRFSKDICLVRNCIVHSLGVIDYASKDDRVRQSRKAIKSNLNNGLSIIDRTGSLGTLFIETDFCMKCINEVIKLFKSLFASSGDMFK
jgi:hypothetical protein